MNLGQFISAHSPLPSGTVAQHLAAMQFGSGTGETVFASRFNVVTVDDRIETTRKAKRTAPAESPAKQRSVEQPSSPKTAYALTATPSLYVRTDRDEIIVTQRQMSLVATRSLEQATINRKRKTK